MSRPTDRIAKRPGPSLPTEHRLWLAELTDGPALGGKARSFARLAAAGLPVPAGFAITDEVFRATLRAVAGGQGTNGATTSHLLLRAAASEGPHLPAPGDLDPATMEALAAAARELAAGNLPGEFEAALLGRLHELGGDRFSVRSSFALEDEPGGVAAGVFESRVDVPLARVPAAVRAVLASALSPAAAAYAAAHGHPLAAPPVAVLVHRFVEADAVGGAAWDPGRPERPPIVDAHHGRPTLGATETIRHAVEALARLYGPVEIEWAAHGDTVTFLQLRPYAAPAPAAPWRGWQDLTDGTAAEAWHWDAGHNPLPLSPAHAGLVAAVDERCRIGVRQRVLGGYLFWSPDGPPSPEHLQPDQLGEGLAALIEDVERHLASLASPPELEAALAGYLPLYERLFGVVQPAARAARARLVELLRAELPEALPLLPRLLAGVPSRAQERLRAAEAVAGARSPAERERALAAYLERFGDEAPAWDVAVATYRERPDLLLAALDSGRERAPGRVEPESAPPAGGPSATPAAGLPWQQTAAGLRERLPPETRPRFDRALESARLAVAAGEDDDWLYARLQAPIRHAIRAVGTRLVETGVLASADDAFWLPLPWLRAAAAGRSLPGDPGRALVHARRAEADARAYPPPLAPPASPETRLGPRAAIALPGSDGHAVLRGTGTGGRAVGRVVHRHGPAGAAPPAGAVLVATSLLPTELPLLRVAALVCETGGPLDHVATQARERGLPAVVGAPGALATLREGDLVVVDADSGLVVRAAGPGGR